MTNNSKDKYKEFIGDKKLIVNKLGDNQYHISLSDTAPVESKSLGLYDDISNIDVDEILN